MLLFNFSHPLTRTHLAAIESLTGQPVERVINIPSQVEVQQPLAPEVLAMADAARLSTTEWQTRPIDYGGVVDGYYHS